MTKQQAVKIHAKIKLCANLSEWFENKGKLVQSGVMLTKAANLFFSLPAKYR